jgi:hypothetical protein
MKRIMLLIIAAVVFFMPSLALTAEPYTYSSGLISSSGAIGTSGTSYALTFIEAITDGTNSATVNVYNGTSTGGVLVGSFACPGPSNFCGATYEIPIACPNGIYISVTGTNAGAIVGYQPR